MKVWAIFLINALDGILTLVWINAGMGTEGNPISAALIAINPILFLAVKFSLGGLLVLAWNLYHKQNKAVQGILTFATMLYCFILGTHIYGAYLYFT
jgi:hypothetical protein